MKLSHISPRLLTGVRLALAAGVAVLLTACVTPPPRTYAVPAPPPQRVFVYPANGQSPSKPSAIATNAMCGQFSKPAWIPAVRMRAPTSAWSCSPPIRPARVRWPARSAAPSSVPSSPGRAMPAPVWSWAAPPAPSSDRQPMPTRRRKRSRPRRRSIKARPPDGREPTRIGGRSARACKDEATRSHEPNTENCRGSAACS